MASHKGTKCCIDEPVRHRDSEASYPARIRRNRTDLTDPRTTGSPAAPAGDLETIEKEPS